MPDGGAAIGRPLCRCHGESADRDGHGRHHCAVKRRARQLAAYHANAAAENYARTRNALRARIRSKRRQIEELEST